MKKYFLLAVFLFSFVGPTNAQLLKVGLNGGISGGARELVDPAIIVDVAYFFQTNNNLQVGAVSGYSHTFKNISDLQYIPVGGGVRYEFNRFGLGADIGYAIVINGGSGGSLYYAPRMGFEINDKVAIMASYRGLTTFFSNWDIVALGVELGL
ncbi:MAG: hypothetical protein HKO61_03950 [Flavobacteriaceae bacterium]|nr:hypothetical protein [Bacteroidia bacterium]NNE03576.1 hypothetical protein [Eudoraea sp.]NNM08297.1 hypothetical protein [Flavobacteriaceae bacterium]